MNDTGIGLSDEQRERLFKPFSQGDTSTTRQFGGTGLGLTISKELAKGLGGDISVESEVGVGSTFTLSVTASTGADSELMCRRPSSGPVVSERRSSGERFLGRVLLAEDGEDNQQYVSLLLRRAGVEFVIVENGARAVEKAGQERFDLILMDMQMPVLDGYSATRALREEGCKVPIVALTANAMKSDVERTFEVGCSSFLGKPFTRASFFSTLARYLPAREVSEVPIEIRQMHEEDKEIKALILSFLDRLPTQLSEIETGVELGDFGMVKAASHKLAGAASLYGIKEVGEAAAALETAAKGEHRGVVVAQAKVLKEGVEAVLTCRAAIENL